MFLSRCVLLQTRSIHLQNLPSTHPQIAYRNLHVTTAKMTVQRVTMFKVANEADIPQFIEQYHTLAQNQKKVCLRRYQLHRLQ
jgi:pantothenate kinase